MNPQQGADLSALRQVMSQQGMNTGILDQQTSGAPGANLANVPPQIPSQGGAPVFAQQAPGMAQQPAPQGQGLPIGNPEAEIILKALTTRLGTHNEIDKAKAGIA